MCVWWGGGVGVGGGGGVSVHARVPSVCGSVRFSSGIDTGDE